jgi:hypothetical protein
VHSASLEHEVAHCDVQMHDWSASASLAPAAYSDLQEVWQLVSPVAQPVIHEE